MAVENGGEDLGPDLDGDLGPDLDEDLGPDLDEGRGQPVVLRSCSSLRICSPVSVSLSSSSFARVCSSASWRVSRAWARS